MSDSSRTIDSQSLAAVSGAQLLDVRTPAEFEDTHIAGSSLSPLDQFDPDQVRRAFDVEAPVYLVCGSGKRASMAAEKLRAAGLECGVVLEGGVGAWESEGLPVERGRMTISIERQVRILAGALVVVGTGLGFLNPWFFALPAFIGSGLVFAGITDTCGMGLAMARMPWNRAVAGSVAEACAIRSTGSGGPAAA